MFKLISTDRLLENYLVYTNMKICQGENKEFVLRRIIKRIMFFTQYKKEMVTIARKIEA